MIHLFEMGTVYLKGYSLHLLISDRQIYVSQAKNFALISQAPSHVIMQAT